jgi:hypothetical protein
LGDGFGGLQPTYCTFMITAALADSINPDLDRPPVKRSIDPFVSEGTEPIRRSKRRNNHLAWA